MHRRCDRDQLDRRSVPADGIRSGLQPRLCALGAFVQVTRAEAVRFTPARHLTSDTSTSSVTCWYAGIRVDSWSLHQPQEHQPRQQVPTKLNNATSEATRLTSADDWPSSLMRASSAQITPIATRPTSEFKEFIRKQCECLLIPLRQEREGAIPGTAIPPEIEIGTANLNVK